MRFISVANSSVVALLGSLLFVSPEGASASPLHEAAAQGDFALAEQLLLGGQGDSFVLEADENGWQPIHEAVKAGNVDVARLLLLHGAQLDVRTSNGGTPLWWSRYLHGEDHDMTRFLKNMNAPDDAEDSSEFSESRMLRRGDADRAEQEWEGDQLEDPAPTPGTTELHFAATQGDSDRILRLLDEQPDLLHVRDSNGWQPLHEAVRSGSVDTVRLLVSRGADLHAKTIGGGTALWWSRLLLGPDHPTVRFLEDIGAPEESDAPEDDLDY
jgi:ankyrin repeat protein